MLLDAAASNPSSMIVQNSGALQLFLMTLCGIHHYMKGNCHRQHRTTWIVWYLYIVMYINRVACRDFSIFLFYFFSTVFKRLCANCVYKLILQLLL